MGSSLALATSTTGTLAAFTAQITGDTNTAASGSLVMEESSGQVTCTSTDAGTNGNTINSNASTCSKINKYAATDLVPGGASKKTTVTITNKGSVKAATFTLTPGACTSGPGATSAPSGSATDLCSKIKVLVAGPGIKAPTTVPTAAKLKPFTLPSLDAGASATYTFEVSLDSSADNAYQNLQASQPLVWNFTS